MVLTIRNLKGIILMCLASICQGLTLRKESLKNQSNQWDHLSLLALIQVLVESQSINLSIEHKITTSIHSVQANNKKVIILHSQIPQLIIPINLCFSNKTQLQIWKVIIIILLQGQDKFRTLHSNILKNKVNSREQWVRACYQQDLAPLILNTN